MILYSLGRTSYSKSTAQYTTGLQKRRTACLLLLFRTIQAKSNLMKCGIISSKKRKLWVIKAVDSRTGRTVAWVLGGRDEATFRRLYAKVKHLENCVFYTDNWDAFAKVMPKPRHVIGKSHTHIIESSNSNTRHHLGRFTRKSKVVSKCEYAVDNALKLEHSLTDYSIFSRFQNQALSIFFYH